MKKLLFIILLTLVPFALIAKEVRGVGAVEYSWFSDDVKAEAIEKAKQDAWRSYTSNFTAAQMTMYQSELKSQFEAELQNLLSNVQVEGEKNDKSADLYTVAIRAKINEALVQELFRRNAAASNQDYRDASDFGSLFLAKVALSQKRFDDRRTDVERTTNNSTVEEDYGSDENSSIDNVNTSDMTVRETGGSTVSRRAETEFAVNEDYNASLTDVVFERLEDAGYFPLEYVELTDCGAPFMEDVYGEFRGNAGMSSRMEKSIRDAAIDCGWSYIGIGSVTLSGHRQDNATGLRAVDANVSYSVWSIEDGRARRVASVRNKTHTAMHESELAAEQEAVIKAAEYAMDTVTAKLQQRRVH
ncbi:hypothetical protein IDSA_08910 [Pseudidiomarina salinarum]|uniref:Uncharacterized protein n=1 Tax=Pseudidiomarina salinarum TaxID=435908 RepID=A0A094IU25_9GAMM|nr:hypothetical protein [Pseudidiomarina salinarum]KFZ30642.1 hypothetical protein IDSA_08910 [Pseudidiomarina salinarum]RUO69153.1 hypothetical protein CWI79_09600 [Pseudidiomarina salinarum]